MKVSLTTLTASAMLITSTFALLGSNAIAEEKKGTAEKAGEIAGEVIGNAVAGVIAGRGATKVMKKMKLNPKSSSDSVNASLGAATGFASTAGKKVGGNYGKYIDKTGNNPLLPKMRKGGKPSGAGGCANKSMANCMIDAVKKAVKGKDAKP